MLVRKSVFDEVGGFSTEKFPIFLGDVDLGLKLQKLGYLNVWTPYARLKHMGGATRLLTDKFKIPPRPSLVDYDRLRETWGGGWLRIRRIIPRYIKWAHPLPCLQTLVVFMNPYPGGRYPLFLQTMSTGLAAEITASFSPLKHLKRTCFVKEE
jgi:hypothetical protein